MKYKVAVKINDTVTSNYSASQKVWACFVQFHLIGVSKTGDVQTTAE